MRYSVHDWAELRRLRERERLSKKAAAEKLGMSRTTVHRLPSLPELPVYERTTRSSLLDPYREAILSMLRDDPKVRATVIRERLEAQAQRLAPTTRAARRSETVEVSFRCFTVLSIRTGLRSFPRPTS